MSYLLLDTASSHHLILLSQSESNWLGSYSKPVPTQSASFLLDTIDDFLTKSDQGYQDLSGIVVGVGPGSLTALRTALSAAQGICVAHQIPVWANSSLKLAALAAAQMFNHCSVRVIMDARSQQVYVGQLDKGCFELSLVPLDMLEQSIGNNPVYILGSNLQEWPYPVISDQWLPHFNQVIQQIIHKDLPGDVFSIEGIYLKSAV